MNLLLKNEFWNNNFGSNYIPEPVKKQPQKNKTFEIIKKIGEGSFGEVFIAKDIERPENIFVVKICKNNTNFIFPPYVLNEIEVMTKVKSSNIISLFEFQYNPQSILT